MKWKTEVSDIKHLERSNRFHNIVNVSERVRAMLHCPKFYIRSHSTAARNVCACVCICALWLRRLFLFGWRCGRCFARSMVNNNRINFKERAQAAHFSIQMRRTAYGRIESRRVRKGWQKADYHVAHVIRCGATESSCLFSLNRMDTKRVCACCPLGKRYKYAPPVKNVKYMMRFVCSRVWNA